MYVKPLIVHGDDDKNKSKNKNKNTSISNQPEETEVSNKDPNKGNIIIRPEDHFVVEQDPDIKELDQTRAPYLRQPNIDYNQQIDHGYIPMKRTKTNDTLYPVEAYTTYDANSSHFPSINDEIIQPSDLTNTSINYATDPRFTTTQPEEEKEDTHPGFIKYNDGHVERVFSGSSTLVNPTLDKKDPNYIEKNRIMKLGLGEVEDEKAKKKNTIGKDFVKAPTSPFHPFLRMDPELARKTNLISYNRSHTPIADVEFRKCFRHILITRPECYIMCNEGKLSQQAALDEDFASIYGRMPYICQMLSPRYIGNQKTLNPDGLNSNWNYLLSNRVLGLSYEPIEIANTEGIAKTTHSFTIATANAQSSGKEGSLQLTFRDTRYFEIFEMIRMWMLYMHKRHVGTFAPPFNGYQYQNGFMNNASTSENGHIDVKGNIKLHPYDRALEYPCTIFDIITDETDTRIIHYSEYIGAYPYQMSAPLHNELSGAITNEMKITVSFKYSAKIINNNRVLTHFNYNAGITNDIGQPTKKFRSEVLPWLLQHEDDPIADNKILMDYSGQSSLFTGSPYIVLKYSRPNPLQKDAEPLYSPYLKFAPITKTDINMGANLGITNMIDRDSNNTGTKSGASTNSESINGTIAGIDKLVNQVSNAFTRINDMELQQQLEEEEKRAYESEQKNIIVGAKNKPLAASASRDVSGIMSQTISLQDIGISFSDFESNGRSTVSDVGVGGASYIGKESEYKTDGKHQLSDDDRGHLVDGILVVNKSWPLNDAANYVPASLTSINGQQVTKHTADAFKEMQAAAKKENLNIWICSGYRSYATQQGCYNKYVARDGKAAADKYSARPGYSEHQTGLAIDINKAGHEFDNTKEAKWLAENCWKYGFILRYPKGKEDITGYEYESWHFRYVTDPELAHRIMLTGTLEEFCDVTSEYVDGQD